RLRRGGDAEVAAEPRLEPAVGGQRRRAIARLGEAAHQPPHRLLRMRVQARLLAAAAHHLLQLARLLGGLGGALIQLDQELAMLIARLKHPVLLEAGEQIALTRQLERLLDLPGVDQFNERSGVDPAALSLEADGLTVSD